MSANHPVRYACPKCKRVLQSTVNALSCSQCGQAYPILNGIPDFLVGDSPEKMAPVLRLAKKADFLAPFYESRFWYSGIQKLSGVGSATMETLINFHAGSLDGVTGVILDVACGTATYGRRLVSPDREVYGIDISQGMLLKGSEFIAREHQQGVHLARGSAMELPFEDEVFDGVICSGSLHLFPDTVLALREIARTMKPGAPLSVQTFLASKNFVISLLKRMPDTTHVFELPELERDLAAAGFEQFRPCFDGSIIKFSVCKSLN